MEARLATLRDRHSSLEDDLSRELARPRPDDTIVSRIKIGKLRLKEEMGQLTASSN